MRRQDKAGEERVAWEVLARSQVVHLGLVGPGGEPILRPLHAIVLDGRVWFHGTPQGEKVEAVGGPAVVMAHEVVAELPSTFAHPKRACPATTLFRSASLHGVLEVEQEPETKARVLQALMERYQPQGGYRAITHDDPMYRAAVRGIGILSVRPERVVCKVALAQAKPAAERMRLVEQLWARGLPGDARAAQAVIDAAPLDPLPELVLGPGGTRLVLAAGEAQVDEATALLAGQYWNVDVPVERLRAAQLGSEAWMVLVAGEQVVATARALSDGAKSSYLLDVAVHEAWRGQGLGAFLVQRMREHPAVRGTRVDLLTRGAGGFYAGLGFERSESEAWRGRAVVGRGS
jgi:nitroimidazol reductase NimA-like FMN-containing flavoprotein (pyridoxamine 5'-phosphate oxidase superfamily)/ribosomal protein S18 acetylase RimI-like enzyme